jgi:hypothetical protein
MNMDDTGNTGPVATRGGFDKAVPTPAPRRRAACACEW